jgi:hypothetical protein
MKSYLVLGDWNAICDQCGRKFKASQLRKRWDGYMVCKEDWETRHPQDFVRPRPDSGKVPWTRPSNDLNPDGTPRVSVAPTFNCSGATLVIYNPLFEATITIGKGETNGPMIVADGATVTILCSMVVN